MVFLTDCFIILLFLIERELLVLSLGLVCIKIDVSVLNFKYLIKSINAYIITGLLLTAWKYGHAADAVLVPADFNRWEFGSCLLLLNKKSVEETKCNHNMW
jgi:hypothetical protein